MGLDPHARQCAGCTMAPACVVCLTMARPRRPPTLQQKKEVSALSFRRAAIASRGLASGALARGRQAWPQRPGMSASITPPVDGFAVIGSEQGSSALPSAGLAAHRPQVHASSVETLSCAAPGHPQCDDDKAVSIRDQGLKVGRVRAAPLSKIRFRTTADLQNISPPTGTV